MTDKDKGSGISKRIVFFVVEFMGPTGCFPTYTAAGAGSTVLMAGVKWNVGERMKADLCTRDPRH